MTHTLHHISIGVTDLAHSALFYDAALATLGHVRVWSDDTAIGYGVGDGCDVLAIKRREFARPPGPGFHLAFAAPSRDAVAAFHAAAIRHGGHDNGAPGLRPHYGPNYYAAFVRDPDGYCLEAVFDTPVSAADDGR